MSDTKSVWQATQSAPASTPLTHNASADVCVVGGGIAGLTAGYLLATEGKSVILLDANDAIGNGETGRTTAHLAWVLDDRFARVASIRGDEITRKAAESHRAAVQLIGAIANRERIECDYQEVFGYLFPGADGPDSVKKEIEALKRLKLPFEELPTPPIAAIPGPCLRFADHAQFHPLKYLSGLVDAFHRHGGMLHSRTRVVRIDSGDTPKVKTDAGHTITAKSIVVATNAPFDAGLTLHTKLAAYLTYAVALPIPRGSVPPALFWDTEDPYHYVRTQAGEGESDFLIVGGEDHKTGQADDQAERWNRLVSWARLRFPMAGAVRHHWSGEVFETPDGLALIGPAPWGRNVFVITGDSGMGMTHGTLGARLVANLIQGKSDPLAEVYNPSRWMTGGLLTFLQENLNLAAQYTDWFTGGDVKSVDQIPPGQGAVIRRGLTKLAVYKDKTGHVCEMSATCPHLGAIVHWNPGEQTWDCPAHGSRYSCDGKVIHGPAVDGLAPVDKATPPTPGGGRGKINDVDKDHPARAGSPGNPEGV